MVVTADPRLAKSPLRLEMVVTDTRSVFITTTS